MIITQMKQMKIFIQILKQTVIQIFIIIQIVNQIQIINTVTEVLTRLNIY